MTMRTLFATLVLASAMSVPLHAEVPKWMPPAPQPRPDVPPPPPPLPEFLMQNIPPLEKTGPGQFKMGNIIIDKVRRTLTFPAQINQQQGLLEYLLVHSRGKVHESLLRTDVEPYYLNIAFLLIGAEGTDRPLKYQGDPATPKGDPLKITISYRSKDGGQVTTRPENWIVLRDPTDRSEEELDTLAWVYTGARVSSGRFAAQTGGSIAAVYHDPDAMIDNASLHDASNKAWFAKDGVVPPFGTEVMVTMKFSN